MGAGEVVARRSTKKSDNTPRLELEGITKQYPGTLANDDVHLKIQPGEIHALLGENGAGKSTLVKIIYGVLNADAGVIRWLGEETKIPNPHAARRLGIGMVFQHFSLFDALTVSDNIALGIEPELARGDLAARIVETSKAYGLPLDPGRAVHTLSVGERQRIEIVRCLLQAPKLLIMDEPTSVLTPQETERLFETLRQLAGEGVSILYISHKLDEIKALCDRATIMRAGKVITECDPKKETAKSMAEMMIGQKLKAPKRPKTAKTAEPLLVVDKLGCAPEDQFACGLEDVSFELLGGEVLGIAGIAGNGQGELMDMLTGERRAGRRDVIAYRGQPVGHLGVQQRRRLGMCFAPEERLGHGAVPEMSLWENGFLSAFTRLGFVKNGFMEIARSQAFADDVIKVYDVRTTGSDQAARSLSGGNLQKFVIGREMMQKPEIMIALQPTWGVDAGSAAAIRQALINLAKEGAGVVVISQDLDELFEISTRIAVISEGRLAKPRPAEKLTVEEIGLIMGGLAQDDAAAADAPRKANSPKRGKASGKSSERGVNA